MKRSLFFAILIGMSSVAVAQTRLEPVQASELENRRILLQDELRISLATRSYTIALPSGESVLFDAVDIEENAGVKTVRGSTRGANLLLTTDGNSAFGYVLKDHKMYVIDTVGRTATIIESENLTLPEYVPEGWGDDFVVNHELILEQNQRRAAQGDVFAKSQALSIVDVAFFYDQSVADNEGLQSPRTRAQAAIDYTNAAIAAHNVALELRVTYVGPLSAPLSGDPYSHFLGNSEKTTTAIDYGADLAHYMYPYGGQTYCGKARLPGDVGISAIGCNSVSVTVAHEIGHNFGLHHDRANASDTGLPYSGYNYGYICGNAGTIMAYYFPVLPHYSSPLLQNNGEDCGVDIGLPDAAYNGAVLDITRTDTANNRTPSDTVGDVWIDTVGPIQANEVDAEVQVTVMRDGDLDVATSVEIGTVGTSATGEQDFSEIAERLEFAPGESTKQVTVSVIDDEKYEPTLEEFQIVLRYPLKLAITGAPLVVQIVSEDPDRGIASFTFAGIDIDESHGTLQIQVDRSGSTVLEHTVDVQIVPVTAVAGIDYVDISGPLTFGVGESTRTFDVPILDDDLFEGDTYVQFTAYLLGDNVDTSRDYFYVRIWNDDFHIGEGQFVADTFYVDENAGAVSIEVERVNGDEGRYNFCVNFVYDGTAINRVDYDGGGSTCSRFNDGETSRTISRNIYDNAEADGEKFFDIRFLAQTGVPGSPTQARVFIIDDEPPAGPTGSIQFGTPAFEGTEGAVTINVPVSRVGGSFGGAVVDYTSSQGTATNGADYNDVAGTLFWVNGDTTDKIIQIPVIDDAVVEPAETLQLTLSGISGATAGSRTIATVTIAESDQPVGLATEYSQSDFADHADNSTVIDFEGYTSPGDYIYLGSPGLFTESGVTITNNSQMYVQNNNFYGSESFLSPQGADPQIVNISLPSGTRAVAFSYGAYTVVSGTATIDGGQQFNLPEVAVGSLGFFAIAREVPIESIQITVNGSSIDIDNLMFASSFQFPEPPFLVPFPSQFADITTFTDVTGDTVPDLAGFVNPVAGVPTISFYSGAAGSVQWSRSYLNDKWTGVGLATVRDADQDGTTDDPAIAMMAVNKATKKIRVQTQRGENGASVSSIQFLNENWTAVDVVVVDDLNGDGITTDSAIAVLAIRKSDGRIQLQLRDLMSGALISNTVYLNARWTAVAAAVADRSAMAPVDTLPPVIGVIAENSTNNKRTMQSRVAGSGAFDRNVKFLGSTWNYNDISVNHDTNGDGTRDDPVWQVLATRSPDAAVWVQARSVADGSFVDNAAILNSNWEVFRLDSALDMGGSLNGEMAVSAVRRSDQTRRINITDIGTGTTTRNIAP